VGQSFALLIGHGMITHNMKYSLSLLVFILYFALFAFRFALPFPYAFFVVGGVIGYFFIYIDRFVQIFLDRQGKKDKVPELDDVKEYMDQAIKSNRVQPVLHSTYFLLIYLPLALFVITSSGSAVGVGLILGIGVYYLTDLWTHYNDHPYITHTYLSEIKHTFTASQARYFLWSVVAIFVLLTIMVWK